MPGEVADRDPRPPGRPSYQGGEHKASSGKEGAYPVRRVSVGLREVAAATVEVPRGRQSEGFPTDLEKPGGPGTGPGSPGGGQGWAGGSSSGASMSWGAGRASLMSPHSDEEVNNSKSG